MPTVCNHRRYFRFRNIQEVFTHRGMSSCIVHDEDGRPAKWCWDCGSLYVPKNNTVIPTAGEMISTEDRGKWISPGTVRWAKQKKEESNA